MKLHLKPVRDWRLGTRLALVLGALALIVFVIVGWVMVTSMRDFLDRRLDDQMVLSQQGSARRSSTTARSPSSRPTGSPSSTRSRTAS